MPIFEVYSNRIPEFFGYLISFAFFELSKVPIPAASFRRWRHAAGLETSSRLRPIFVPANVSRSPASMMTGAMPLAGQSCAVSKWASLETLCRPTFWWARQDSNLQPDRYERPALTIELQAPPRCRSRDRQRCRHPLQCGWRSGNAAFPCPFNPPRPRRTRPPCAISRSHQRRACRTLPASSALEFRRFRQAARPAWDLSALHRPPC
jgi:hypothetical protein